MAGNTLTGLIPTIYTALDVVSREQVGFIPAVAKNAKADAAAKDQTVTAPVAPDAKTEDIVPGPSAPNTGDQNIGTVDVKITKSKMAPVKWNGEEQLALGPSGTYNTILADQFKQAFRALANEVVGSFTANMAFDRNAFLLASRTPAMPEGGDSADDVMNVTDPISGITFQIALYRQYRQVRYEVGLAWGVSSVKPAHSCLIIG
ncbi:hypothetical protein ACU8CR_004231 [Escherichia coli]